MVVRLERGDCAELLTGVFSDSIDLTVTSPPYDNLRTYNGNIAQWSFEKFKAIAAELYRVTKPGGVVVWVVGDATVKGSETGTSFKQALYFMECGFNLHDTMIWVKDGGGAIGSNKCYTQNFEYMFVLSKDSPKSINLIRDKKNISHGKIKTNVGRRKPDGTLKHESRKPTALFAKRNNWWFIFPVNSSIERTGHPAQFPERLATDHIISWSNEGDIVLDPFMGSGTTGVAAVNTGRNFIGIELDADYFEIAQRRIAEAQEAKTMERWRNSVDKT